ncbi:hypothetical protein [Thalassotalea agarivorans]|uniref:hypothetical protein n=1 Tax=Thalassotalea agarivorans TaxID=349064 RepID=UPI00115FF472|nr:hypothetical protein [Thalassotalea agarivorans]
MLKQLTLFVQDTSKYVIACAILFLFFELANRTFRAFTPFIDVKRYTNNPLTHRKLYLSLTYIGVAAILALNIFIHFAQYASLGYPFYVTAGFACFVGASMVVIYIVYDYLCIQAVSRQ